MSYGGGPAATSDQYQNGLLWLETQECLLLDVWVTDNPCFYQLKLPSDLIFDDSWSAEHYLAGATGVTAFYSFGRRFSGVRFRSAVSGKSATIVYQAIPAAELPLA